MNRADLARQIKFKKGQYAGETIFEKKNGEGKVQPLLQLSFERDDEAAGRYLPMVKLTAEPKKVREIVASALVRAGVRHPGVRDEDLAHLHAAARKSGHLEFFDDGRVPRIPEFCAPHALAR